MAIQNVRILGQLSPISMQQNLHEGSTAPELCFRTLAVILVSDLFGRTWTSRANSWSGNELERSSKLKDSMQQRRRGRGWLSG